MDKFYSRKCLQCEKELSGRVDKSFCDAYCRNTFNNQNKPESEHYIASVNSVIRRNRKILKELCPIGKATVRKEVLDAMHYDFRHFTGTYKSNKGQQYFICYDYAMSPILEKNVRSGEAIKKVLIVKKQAYFDAYQPELW